MPQEAAQTLCLNQPQPALRNQPRQLKPPLRHQTTHHACTVRPLLLRLYTNNGVPHTPLNTQAAVGAAAGWRSGGCGLVTRQQQQQQRRHSAPFAQLSTTCVPPAAAAVHTQRPRWLCGASQLTAGATRASTQHEEAAAPAQPWSYQPHPWLCAQGVSLLYCSGKQLAGQLCVCGADAGAGQPATPRSAAVPDSSPFSP